MWNWEFEMINLHLEMNFEMDLGYPDGDAQMTRTQENLELEMWNRDLGVRNRRARKCSTGSAYYSQGSVFSFRFVLFLVASFWFSCCIPQYEL